MNRYYISIKVQVYIYEYKYLSIYACSVCSIQTFNLGPGLSVLVRGSHSEPSQRQQEVQ